MNNAGTIVAGGLVASDLDALQRPISLNVTAVTRLAGAGVPRFVAEGNGAIINLSSVLALAPEIFPGLYAATKAFVLAFSQSLQAERGRAAATCRRCCRVSRAPRSGTMPVATRTPYPG